MANSTTSSQLFGNLGGAVSDLFAGIGASTQADLKAQSDRLQAQGDLAEAANYDLAASYAGLNAGYTADSTAIKQQQQDRETMMAIGGQKAAIAGSGLAASGSALDVLRDSAAQGQLAKSVLGAQGQITEASYQEQQQSYENMSAAAKSTAAGLQNIANETEQAGQSQGIGDFFSGAIKGVAALATLFP